MKEPRRIAFPAFVKFQTIMGSIFGLIMGIIYAFGGFLIDTFVSLNWLNHPETTGLSYGTILAFGALIGMPIIFAGIGFLIGIFEVMLFNLLSKRLDWLDLNFEQK